MKNLLLLMTTMAATAALQADSGDVFRVELPGGYYRADARHPTDKDVHITVWTTGSFGGRDIGGSPLETPLGEGAGRAKTLKAILYAKGCAFDTFAAEVPPTGSLTMRFACRPLPTVPLTGAVADLDSPSGKKIVAIYSSSLGHSFFGYADGSPYMTAVADAVLDDAGHFTIAIPDFINDPVHQRHGGGGQLYLSIGGALLSPRSAPEAFTIPIHAGYPAIEFVLTRRALARSP